MCQYLRPKRFREAAEVKGTHSEVCATCIDEVSFTQYTRFVLGRGADAMSSAVRSSDSLRGIAQKGHCSCCCPPKSLR
jgi:hypothetical protein